MRKDVRSKDSYWEARRWTEPGDDRFARHTYYEVSRLISKGIGITGVEIYLQGSYANKTNTRGDSDVDILVVAPAAYPSPWAREVAKVPPQEFRNRLETLLRDRYGDAVQGAEKCLRVDGFRRADGTLERINADIVPAHKVWYTPPSGTGYRDKISISPVKGDPIENYPKAHRINGSRKNGRCSGRYKPTVRQLKCLRRKAVEQGLVEENLAPGYLLECLAYNVPDDLFVPNDFDRLVAVADCLSSRSVDDLRAFKAGDGVYDLFINDPGCYDAERIVTVLAGITSVL